MQLQVFVIHDTKSETFSKPFFQHTEAEALRSFAQAAKDPNTTICQFPEDYDLYHTGMFDDQTGLVKPLQTPRHLTKAIHTIKTQGSVPDSTVTALSAKKRKSKV